MARLHVATAISCLLIQEAILNREIAHVGRTWVVLQCRPLLVVVCFRGAMWGARKAVVALERWLLGVVERRWLKDKSD